MDFVNPSRGHGRLNFSIICVIVVVVLMVGFVGFQKFKDRQKSFESFATAVEACDAYENGEDITGAVVTVVTNTDREGSYGGRRIYVNNNSETASENTVIVNLNSSGSVSTASVVAVKITDVVTRDNIVEIYGNAS